MKKIILTLIALSLTAFAVSVEIGPFKTISEAKIYKDNNPDQGITAIKVRGAHGQLNGKTVELEKGIFIVKYGFENKESAQDFIETLNIKNAKIK